MLFKCQCCPCQFASSCHCTTKFMILAALHLVGCYIENGWVHISFGTACREVNVFWKGQRTVASCRGIDALRDDFAAATVLLCQVTGSTRCRIMSKCLGNSLLLAQMFLVHSVGTYWVLYVTSIVVSYWLGGRPAAEPVGRLLSQWRSFIFQKAIYTFFCTIMSLYSIRLQWINI